jgi:hypothetical protein
MSVFTFKELVSLVFKLLSLLFVRHDGVLLYEPLQSLPETSIANLRSYKYTSSAIHSSENQLTASSHTGWYAGSTLLLKKCDWRPFHLNI